MLTAVSWLDRPQSKLSRSARRMVGYNWEGFE
jgi:hypothetical protein